MDIPIERNITYHMSRALTHKPPFLHLHDPPILEKTFIHTSEPVTAGNATLCGFCRVFFL